MSAALKCQRCDNEFTATRSDALWCPVCQVVREKERSQKYESRVKVACPDCRNPMGRGAEYCLPCSNRHRGEKRRAENNGNWKNGRTMNSGYVFVRVGHVRGQGAYRPEHCLVWEEANGPIPKGWVIHHLNGVKTDNRLSNLAAMPRNSHHPDHLAKPYQQRIRELEVKLAPAAEHQIGNSLDSTAMKTLGGTPKAKKTPKNQIVG